VVDYSHREFDVIREQEFNIIKCENFYILNAGMLNNKQTKNNPK